MWSSRAFSCAPILSDRGPGRSTGVTPAGASRHDSPAAPGAVGSSTRKVDPRPMPSLSASTRPPWASTIRRTIVRPSPRPRVVRVLLASACRKASNTCGRKSGDDAASRCPRPRSPGGRRDRRLKVDAPAGRRELDRVGQQVPDACRRRSGSADRSGRSGGTDTCRVDALRRRRRRNAFHGLVDDPRHARAAHRHTRTPAGEPREVEEVVHEPRLGQRVALDHRQRVLDARLRHLPPQQHVRPPDDGVERGAELVRHGREELVLQPVGGLGLVEQPLPQLLLQALLGDVAERADDQVGADLAAPSGQQHLAAAGGRVFALPRDGLAAAERLVVAALRWRIRGELGGGPANEIRQSGGR